jgi:hypothetical protein
MRFVQISGRIAPIVPITLRLSVRCGLVQGTIAHLAPPAVRNDHLILLILLRLKDQRIGIRGVVPKPFPVVLRMIVAVRAEQN